MPAPHPTDLRERVVRAYEQTGESIPVVAARFGVAPAALQRWLRRKREVDTVAPRAKGGGNPSPVDIETLTTIVVELRDATTYELTAAYNQRVAKSARVHRSSVQRALRRAGYVFKKNAFVPSSNRDQTSRPSARASLDG
jgi:transposase